MGSQGVTLLCRLVRASGAVGSQEDLTKALATQAAQQLPPHDVVTAERKFSSLMLLKAGCRQVVLRRPKNVTLRRAQPPAYSGRGRPARRGGLIRPLPRRYQGREIPASEPDATCSWQEVRADGTRLTPTARWWRNVIPTKQADWLPSDQALMARQAWTAVVIQHPDFDESMVILMNVALTPRQAAQVVCGRWGIEQPPLVAKQLLGLHRQAPLGCRGVVWAPDMRLGWPEPSLVAATILTYVGATVRDPIPTGWWDRRPRATAGHLRRQ